MSKKKFIETESRMVVAKGWWGGCRISIGLDEKVLEMGLVE
jgi:hypothetical protein